MIRQDIIERWAEIIYDHLYKGGYADVSRADARALAERLWSSIK